MDDSLQSISQKLDTLSLAYLSKMNDYAHQRSAVAKELQKGFLDLAHAKYTMGAKTISHFSYDERMKAQVRVGQHDSDDDDKEDKSGHTANDDTFNEFFIQRTDDATNKTLRQRKTNRGEVWVQKEPQDDEDQQEWELDEKKSGKKSTKVRANNDPLHWFGLLVSPSLRTSQDHFKKALPHIVEIANMVRQLEVLEKQYKDLEAKKANKTLENDAS
ncbi:hypothetical protein BC940DRAFT_79077 [Gongronella butleri]|nr:hypothetical protein BC940DRAFT_79077 [Gongronella butleri]